MNDETDVYNLLDQAWIPVLWNNGRVSRLGIRETLKKAHLIREIAATNPMDRVAILRFLLTVLYWCQGNPPEQAGAIRVDPFPADWFSRLDANRDCFNLLGEGRRFLQDLTAKRRRGVTDLVQEIPTGNNFWHFRHSTDEQQGLCPACCALGLIRLPLFSVSGLPDLKSGINGTPPIYVVPWGSSLLETLRVNWRVHANLGEPAWMQPDIRAVPGQDVPLLTGMTLLSRRVRLHDPTPAFEPCLGCGAKVGALIRSCEFQSAGKQENDHWNDPHVLYSDDSPRKSSKAADLTRAGTFAMDRPWPRLIARMLETGRFQTSDAPLSFLIVGFATDKAKNIDVWERTLVGPSPQTISEGTGSLIERWTKEGTSLARRLRPTTKKKVSREYKTIAATLGTIRPDVEHRVAAMAGGLLSGADDAWQNAADEYRALMRAVAGSLSPGYTSAAVRRRERIASATPDMRPDREAGSKGKKKGGKS